MYVEDFNKRSLTDIAKKLMTSAAFSSAAQDSFKVSTHQTDQSFDKMLGGINPKSSITAPARAAQEKRKKKDASWFFLRGVLEEDYGLGQAVKDCHPWDQRLGLYGILGGTASLLADSAIESKNDGLGEQFNGNSNSDPAQSLTPGASRDLTTDIEPEAPKPIVQ